MKGKIILLSAVSLLTVGVALHVGHEPPADGVCPPGKMMHSKDAKVATAAEQKAEAHLSGTAKDAAANIKN